MKALKKFVVSAFITVLFLWAVLVLFLWTVPTVTISIGVTCVLCGRNPVEPVVDALMHLGLGDVNTPRKPVRLWEEVLSGLA